MTNQLKELTHENIKLKSRVDEKLRDFAPTGNRMSTTFKCSGAGRGGPEVEEDESDEAETSEEDAEDMLRRIAGEENPLVVPARVHVSAKDAMLDLRVKRYPRMNNKQRRQFATIRTRVRTNGTGRGVSTGTEWGWGDTVCNQARGLALARLFTKASH